MARLRPTRIGFRAQINGTYGGASAGSGPSESEVNSGREEQTAGNTGAVAQQNRVAIRRQRLFGRHRRGHGAACEKANSTQGHVLRVV